MDGVERRLDDEAGPFSFEEFLEYYETDTEAQQRWDAAADSCNSQQPSNKTKSLARTLQCSCCLQPKEKHQYSNTQWKKSPRKCQECVQQRLGLAGETGTLERTKQPHSPFRHANASLAEQEMVCSGSLVELYVAEVRAPLNNQLRRMHAKTFCYAQQLSSSSVPEACLLSSESTGYRGGQV